MTVIAIPLLGDEVHPHTGDSLEYLLVRWEQNLVLGDLAMDAQDNAKLVQKLQIQSGCLCRTQLLHQLKAAGVTHLITHHMGPRAWSKAKRLGFEVLRGNSGAWNEILQRFVQGQVRDVPVPCDKSHSSCRIH